jgi:hypothetical protein
MSGISTTRFLARMFELTVDRESVAGEFLIVTYVTATSAVLRLIATARCLLLVLHESHRLPLAELAA